jgi:hypothetical protein
VKFNFAEAGLSQDGTPYLNVRPGLELTDELIAHELSHIELILQGFPKLDLVGIPALHVWLRSDVLDVVQHRIFYPRLRAAGFRPDLERIREARAIIGRGTFAASSLSLFDIASRYFRVAMETDSAPLLAEMTEWYASKGWNEARRLGNSAYLQVRQRTVWEPQDEVEACIDSANILLSGHATLRFIRSESERYGAVTQHYAVISIAGRG